MGLRTDEDLEALEAAAGEVDPDDPLGYALAVYDFLTVCGDPAPAAAHQRHPGEPMSYPAFFDLVPRVRMHDPLAEFLGRL